MQAGSEVRTITAKMFEKAGAYQTFGMNVECATDSLSVSVTLLKNSANITVSVDLHYVAASSDRDYKLVKEAVYDFGRKAHRNTGKGKIRDG